MANYTTVQEKVSIFRRIYDRIKEETSPEPQWKWWSTGELMNGDKLKEWSQDTNELENLLSKTEQFLKKNSLRNNGCDEFPKCVSSNCSEFPALACIKLKELAECTRRMHNKYL